MICIERQYKSEFSPKKKKNYNDGEFKEKQKQKQKRKMYNLGFIW